MVATGGEFHTNMIDWQISRSIFFQNGGVQSKQTCRSWFSITIKHDFGLFRVRSDQITKSDQINKSVVDYENNMM